MKTVSVVGMGIMGAGIAQACAQAGYSVNVIELDPKIMDKGFSEIAASLAKMEEGGKLNEPKEQVLSRIHLTQSLDESSKAELIIEAIFENLEAKRNLFTRFGEICSYQTIFATNTSSIPVTEIFSAVKRPERAVGIHFFNPVRRMRLVEVVKGYLTSDQTLSRATDFVLSLKKEPVVVRRDTAGFIVNRINGMAFLEALRLVERGVATHEDIDKAMRLGLGHPLGPFELMDLVGLDVVLNARLGIYDETRDPNHYPPAQLKRMVKAGWLGRKSGKGFYDYSK